MPQHEEKICPRCSTVFECKMGNITACQCKNIQLSYDEFAFIEEQYTDCLCVNCLATLQKQYQQLKRQNGFV